MEKLTLQDRIPKDLLQRFMAGSASRKFQETVEDDGGSGEIELNLGLSLGGRFGVDKSSSYKLVRSSSIAGPIPLVRDEHEPVTPPAVAAHGGLSRTSSLPVETEEEWRKRKEMQSLRRLEAKRRRSEKQRVVKGDCKDEERREVEGSLRRRDQREQYVAAMNKVGSSVAPPFGLPSWGAAARQAILGGGGDDVLMGREKGNYVIDRQRSIDSQGGCSSSMSELDWKPLKGSSSCGDLSRASINEDTVGGPSSSSGSKSGENTGRPPSGADKNNSTKRTEASGNRRMNSLEDMPCVFTKGDGPNGRRIEGILYKYGRGEEVRIMCVCHGSFHSPAGFVKHAGGTDITHPLKHIVVDRNSSFS